MPSATMIASSYASMPKSTLLTRRACLEAATALGAQLAIGGCRSSSHPVDADGSTQGETGPEAPPQPEPPAPVEAAPETPAKPALEAPAIIHRVTRPHVLFISIDDLNDWVGVLGGHPRAKTPNIDALAHSGMLFSNAHCAAPSCNGSRTATMTGLRPSTSGVYANSHPWRQHLPDVVTIPDHFKRSGYRSIGAGKMFHGPFPDPGAWDDYFPSACRQIPKNREETKRGKKPGKSGIAKMGNFDWGPLDKTDAQMGDGKVVDWVIDNLPKAGEDPTFLACGLYRPHLPWYVPQKWFDMFPLADCSLPQVRARDREDIPKGALRRLKYDNDHAKIVDAGQWRHAVQAYLASCAFADAMLGRLIDALRKSSVAADTLVVLWSDHGWHLGEKLKWRKFTLWEEATRVPLIVAGAGVPRPGVCNSPVSLLDVYPTLTELCGLPPNEAHEGHAFTELLSDPKAGRRRAAITTWGRKNHSIRTRRWRYTRYKSAGEELYDHDADPHEWTNLASDPAYAKVIKRLKARLPKKSAKSAPKRGTYPKDAFACDPDALAEDDGDEGLDG